MDQQAGLDARGTAETINSIAARAGSLNAIGKQRWHLAASLGKGLSLVPAFWGVVPTLGSAIPPWRHLGKVLIQAERGGKILLVIVVVDVWWIQQSSPTLMAQLHPQTHIHTLMAGVSYLTRHIQMCHI